MMRFGLFVISFFCLAIITPFTIHAHGPNYVEEDGTPELWASSNFPVYAPEAGSCNGLDRNTMLTLLGQVATTIDGVTDSTMDVTISSANLKTVTGLTTTADITVDNADRVLFMFSYSPVLYINGQSPVIFDDDFAITAAMGGSSTVLGFASSYVSLLTDTATSIKSEIVINCAHSLFDNNQVELEAVLTHELLHTVGLGHSEVSAAESYQPLMYPIVVYGASDTIALKADDEIGVASAYPEATLTQNYGTLTGTFVDASDAPYTCANLTFNNVADSGSDLFSYVTATTAEFNDANSDYLTTASECVTGCGDFSVNGFTANATYSISAKPINSGFTGGSLVGRCDPPNSNIPTVTFDSGVKIAAGTTQNITIKCLNTDCSQSTVTCDDSSACVSLTTAESTESDGSSGDTQVDSVEDAEDDGDGDDNDIPDALEIDSDSDGLSDAQDTDDDANGVEDVVETDTDGDDTMDVDDTDDDGDGTDDVADTDDDGDGVQDLIETDTDGDGTANASDTDDDGDGTDDVDDADDDGDGTEDALDDTGDGLIEGDTDGDGATDDGTTAASGCALVRQAQNPTGDTLPFFILTVIAVLCGIRFGKNYGAVTIAVVGVVLLLSGPAQATVLSDDAGCLYTMEDDADVIVDATILSADNASVTPSTGFTLPATRYIVKVHTAYKGTVSALSTLTFYQYGHYTPTAVDYFVKPLGLRYKVGTRYILFLTAESAWGLRNAVGLYAGAFSYGNVSGITTLTNGLNNRGLFSSCSAARLASEDGALSSMVRNAITQITAQENGPVMRTILRIFLQR